MQRKALAFALGCLLPGFSTFTASAQSFIGPLSRLDSLASTVPTNGDLNPYGVAVAPQTVGQLQKDDVLVNNFNNADNLQGTGTTIVQLFTRNSQHEPVRSDRSQSSARSLPRWRRPNDCSRSPSVWICYSRKPTHERRYIRDHAGGVLDCVE